MQTIIKITLAILFFICLARMPYGYYQLVRFLSLTGFSILAYHAFKKEKQIEMVIYGALALLFQPFLKVALGRELWNIVDVIVGIGLLLSLFADRDKEGKNRRDKNEKAISTISQKDLNQSDINYQEERRTTNKN